MKSNYAVTLVVITTLSCGPGAVSGQGHLDQAMIAKKLLGASAAERSRALEAARSLPAADTTPELRRALVTLLERENRLLANIARRGGILAEFEDPEFIASLARTVADLRDPAAIPALAEAIYGGGHVLLALAEFGDKAVQPTVAAVEAPTSHYDVVNHGLQALILLIDGKEERPLSSQSLDAIRRAALSRLSGPQYFTTLWHAIDLASVVEDPELTGIIASIAHDRSAVLARGLTDSELISSTQRRAQDRLSGVVPRSRTIRPRPIGR